jgi:hypothetical protein
MENKRDEVEFKQIAVVGSNVEHWLYGLSKDGEVYQYNHRAALWEPLAMAVNGGYGGGEVEARTEAESNTSLAQPCGSRYRGKWNNSDME